MAVLLVYSGLVLAVVGVLRIMVPSRFMRHARRHRGFGTLLAGLVLAFIGMIWPAPLDRVTERRDRLDDFLPAFHFREFHSLRVHAPPERVYRAVKDVRAAEIRGFATLMGIRALPGRLLGNRPPRPALPGYRVASWRRESYRRHDMTIDHSRGTTTSVEGAETWVEYRSAAGASAPGPRILQVHEAVIARLGGTLVSRDPCCNATFRFGEGPSTAWVELATSYDGEAYRLTLVQPAAEHWMETRPLIEAMTRSGFMLLSKERDREIVLGEVVRFWSLTGGGSAPVAEPRAFAAFDRPGYAKVAFNIRVEDAGRGWSRVTTETRILGTDPPARRMFGVYWRLIYPGSATIRRMWLEAIKRRAERAAPLTFRITD